MVNICAVRLSDSCCHLAMSLGDRFCVSREARTGEGGWAHLKCANSIAVSGLGRESPLLEVGRLVLSINVPRMHACPLTLYSFQFQYSKWVSTVWASWSNTHQWVGMVRIMNVLRIAECSAMFSLGVRNSTKHDLGYLWIHCKIKTDLQCYMAGKELTRQSQELLVNLG